MSARLGLKRSERGMKQMGLDGGDPAGSYSCSIIVTKLELLSEMPAQAYAHARTSTCTHKAA